MAGRVYSPLWPLLESLVADRQPRRTLPRANKDGWIEPCHSPLRKDKNPSFSVKPDSENDAGAWKDHATGEGGSMADLARRLRVDRPAPRDTSPTLTLAAFCAQRHLDAKRLSGVWRVRGQVFEGRPALVFPTGRGDRVKFLDGQKPKCRWVSHGDAHWYGLRTAAKKHGDTLNLVNGEPSVWACDHAGVPGVCLCAGEGTLPTPALIEELRKSRFKTFAVVYDCDAAGRKGGVALAAALRAAGFDARALALPASLGEGGDVDDLHRIHGPKLGAVLATLAELTAAQEASPKQRDPAESLAPLHSLTATSTLAEITMALHDFARCAKFLDPIAREVARDGAVKCLSKLDVSRPARMMDAALPKPQAPDDAGGAGKPLTLSDPDLWPEPVKGAELLGELVRTVRRFVVMAPEHAVAVALWTVFTFLHDVFTISPLLAVSSPEKRCGKTRLLELLGALVRRPLFASNITPAAVFRAVEAYSPTLILDEAETYIRGDNDDLRGILNSGHSKKTAFVARTVGDDHEVRLFKTFCPKVAALIGNLPSTLEDRSITIRLRRKTPDEVVEHLRVDQLDDLAPLRSKAARWAQDNAESFTVADPRVPDEILSDRARDNWRPLLAIADAAGSDWPSRARNAAVVLAGVEAAAESAGVTLLGDLDDLFTTQGTERLTSEVIVEALAKMEERPWPEWYHGRQITARGVAKLLKPFNVVPRVFRADGKTPRGYHFKDFEDAFSRYLGGARSQQAQHDSKQSTYDHPVSATRCASVADNLSRNPSGVNDVADVADTEGGMESGTPPSGGVGGDRSRNGGLDL